ncbi:SPOR domain-containing protein, partial [Geomonas sp.]|uniref:SPOR domain-containing protein n=1 Tax=Geomonas sp. TaxID=2651584 RepID=UPI002B47F885
KENGRYAVYGGSYMREAKAAAEQDRLYAKGVKLVMKTASAPVTVMNLRGGSFPDKVKAERAANALKKNGVTAKAVKAAR